MWDKPTYTGKSSFLFIDVKVLTTAIQWNSRIINKKGHVKLECWVLKLREAGAFVSH